MKEIQGEARRISELLGGKFSIDYYQREYRWETKHVVKLIEDLTEKFLESHRPNNTRVAVRDYGRYFLGSIIVSDKGNERFIIDGQQRLTSVTLLLVHLYRHTSDEGQRQQLLDLIRSYQFGTPSFNLDVDERHACMEALFSGNPFDPDGQPESVVNLAARFRDIEENLNFPENLPAKDTIPYFADWLMENVYLVEITAYSDTDAYVIFETMNDRGLSLTPIEMLKGYLLSNISPDRRDGASAVWKERVESLRKLGKDSDADAIKTWLRSQYAETIRERKQGARPQDFDLIGTEFHRWVRDRETELSLTDSVAFADFICKDFVFYSRRYETIVRASENLTLGLEAVHYNASHNFTLQYPVLLAPIRCDDAEDQVRSKLRVVSTFIDILIARRVWNFKATGYSTMQYAMFQLIRTIRGKSVAELADILHKRLAGSNVTFDPANRFRLHGTNGPQIHRLLARITDYIETRSGRPSRYAEYVRRSGKNAHEVEHIWANRPERHKNEFPDSRDFEEYRNRIGGLLLLPKSFNASFGDKPYGEKRDEYLKQNLLAQSLCDQAYQHDPGFKNFIRQSGLPFHPHAEFKKADLDARQELYRKIAEQVWDPDSLLREASAET